MNKSANLTRSSHKVKTLSCFALFFLLLMPKVQAKSSISQVILLSRGQQKEISLKNLKKISVGNREVLGVKPHGNFLMLRGNKVGFSDLVFWDQKSKHTYKVYVLSKKTQLQLGQIAESLGENQLNIEPQGKFLVVQGEIRELDHYRQFQKTLSKFSDQILDQTILSTSLKNELIAKVYQKIMGAGIRQINCHSFHSKIQCQVDKKEIDPILLSRLEDQYFIHFLDFKTYSFQDNYWAKLSFYQIEISKENHQGFGLQEISATMGDFINQGGSALISQNPIRIGQFKGRVSTLARPEQIIKLNHPSLFKYGTEIPYTSSSTNNGVLNTQWRFAGLKIQLLLKAFMGKLVLEHEMEWTTPSQERVSGLQEKSIINIAEGQKHRFLQLNLSHLNSADQHFPKLEKIPILGVFFQSKTKTSSYKYLFAYIEIKKESL